MKKIASPQELQSAIRDLMADIHGSEKPDRQAIASKLRKLANRVAGYDPADEAVEFIQQGSRHEIFNEFHQKQVELERAFKDAQRTLKNQQRIGMGATGAVDVVKGSILPWLRDIHDELGEIIQAVKDL